MWQDLQTEWSSVSRWYLIVGRLFNSLRPQATSHADTRSRHRQQSPLSLFQIQQETILFYGERPCWETRCCFFNRQRVTEARATRCLTTKATACSGVNCFRGRTAFNISRMLAIERAGNCSSSVMVNKMVYTLQILCVLYASAGKTD